MSPDTYQVVSVLRRPNESSSLEIFVTTEAGTRAEHPFAAFRGPNRRDLCVAAEDVLRRKGWRWRAEDVLHEEPTS